MSRYRGMKINGVLGFGAKVQLKRSIDLRQLADFGLITDETNDLPTAGAVHRGSLNSTSATRGYTNLSTITDTVVVDTQDFGLITDDEDDGLSYNNEPYQY